MANQKVLQIFKLIKNTSPWTKKLYIGKVKDALKFRQGQLTYQNNSSLQVATFPTVFSAFIFWTAIYNYSKNIQPILAISFPKKKSEETGVGSSINLLTTEADQLYDQLKFEELYQLLITNKDENNDEILWRLSRVLYRLSKSEESKEKKIELLSQAQDYVYKALKINDKNFASHKWASIVVVELAGFHGTKAKLQQAYVSKEHMLRAHELNPKDGTTLYLLGLWCYTFADLSWAQRKVASVLFATPPASSFEEAYSYFAKAEEVDPGCYSKNLLMLGKTHMKLGDKVKAIEFLKKARDYRQKTEDDKEAHQEAVELLKKLGAD